MRTRRIVVAVAMAAVGVVAIANISGLAPIPVGPLGSVFDPEPAAHQVTTPFHTYAVYTTADVRNTWPLPVTLVSVSPIVRTDPVSATVLGALPYDLDNPVIGRGEVNGILMGLESTPQTAWASPPPVAGTTVAPDDGTYHRGTAILVRIAPTGTGAVDVAGYTVDYALGPLRFRATSTAYSVLMCSLADTSPDGCSEPEEE